MKIAKLLKVYAMVVVGLAVIAIGTTQCYARNASAKNTWNQNHPRRAEVNKRLGNQNKRIKQGVKSGTLTQAEAKQLKIDDKQIRQEERTMASENGGHITKAEQKSLNQQENAVSKQIYQEKHD